MLLRKLLIRHLLHLLIAGAFGVAASAWAGNGPENSALAPEDQARLLKIITEALQDKNITQQQYEQSAAWIKANPCRLVDRKLTAKQRALLEAAIAKQQKLKKVSVFATFRSYGWSIVFSDAGNSDSSYFFYSRNPVTGAEPVTAWAGGATIFETTEIAEWVKQNAPGIPLRLADCFAWQVTLDPR